MANKTYLNFNMEGVEDLHLMEQLKEYNSYDEKKPYLPINFKKMWFLSKHPEGVIRYEVNHSDMEYATVTARLYNNCTLPTEQYNAEARATAYISMLTDIYPSQTMKIEKLLATAKGLAATYVLTEAGYGLQFYDKDMDSLDMESTNKETVDTVSPTLSVEDRLEEAVSASTEPQTSTDSVPKETFSINGQTVVVPQALTQETMSKEMQVLNMVSEVDVAKKAVARYGVTQGKTLGELLDQPQQIAYQYTKAIEDQNQELSTACLLLAKNNSNIKDIFETYGINIVENEKIA